MGKRLDCLFVRPNNQKVVYPGLEEAHLTAIEPPLWAAILAGYLRFHKYGVDILDAQIESLSYEETAKRINDRNPLLTVLSVSGSNPSASTMNMMGVEGLAPLIRSPVLVHGLHASALPAETAAMKGVTYACQGEGFHTIPLLLEALETNYAEAIDHIGGLWTPDTVWKDYPTLLDITHIPRPAWDLLPIKRYRAHFYMCFDGRPRSPYALLYTSLGCPYPCTFCCINALFGERTFRVRDEDEVLSELKRLVDTYGVSNIKIMDEMFTLRKGRVISLCNRIARMNLGLNMRAFARIDYIDDYLLEAMKKAGINWIVYGFESGSQKVLDTMEKGTHIENMRKVVEMTRKHGILVDGDFMMGGEGDNDETHKETFQLMLELQCAWTNIYTTMPFPGSPLFTTAQKGGWVPPRHFTGYSQYTPDTHPLRGEWATRWRDWAFNSYNSNPSYRMSLRRRFGDSAVRMIDNMLKVPLRRNYS